MTVGTSKCCWAACAITRFVLSPFVVTTTASASSIPESPERVLVLVEDGHVPARALQLERDGRADAAASDHDCLHSRAGYSGPLGRRQLLVEDRLRERDDQDLARCLAQHVVDRGREEPRLPPPAGRGAEDDQVGVDLERALDDRLADRPGADDG